MRGVSPLAILFICAHMLVAQQTPFIAVTGTNAPKGAAFLFEDSEGGMWLGGTEGSSELRYFDGTHFINRSPESCQKESAKLAPAPNIQMSNTR